MGYFVICYDITENKPRRLVVKLLEDAGAVRVQYSVFEIRCSRKKLQRLLKNLEQEICVKEDSVMAYNLCLGCQAKINRRGNAVCLSNDRVVVV